MGLTNWDGRGGREERGGERNGGLNGLLHERAERNGFLRAAPDALICRADFSAPGGRPSGRDRGFFIMARGRWSPV